MGITGAAANAATTAAEHSLVGDLAWIGLNTWGASGMYKSAREQGNGKIVSVAKAAGSFVLGEIAPTPYLIYSLGSAAWNISKAVSESTTEQMRQGYKRRGRLGSGYFNMTEAGYTMRQRSINAIRSNGMNVQSALGNEARNYFRTY